MQNEHWRWKSGSDTSQADWLIDSGYVRVCLTGTFRASATARNANGILRRGKSASDFSPPALPAAVRTFPNFASLYYSFVRRRIHSRVGNVSQISCVEKEIAFDRII
jgi:hypothetical protein